MFEHSSPGIWILLLLGIATAAPARADGPRAGLKLSAEDTFISPDRAARVEQYAESGMDENYAWLGEHWPDSRRVVVSLSFDAPRAKKRPCHGSKAGLRL